MILMALDHTRDFLGVGANPVDLATTTSSLFFTRWITHFCAPTFFLLTGTSAYLSRRGKSDSQLSWHLFTRGAWLILLKVTVFRCLALQFNFDYRTTLLLVLWALGWAMIALSVLIYLPRPAIATFGLVLILGHNAVPALSAHDTRARAVLFYYLVHFALIHLIAVVVCYARYGEVHWLFESPSIAQAPFTSPPGWGLSLPWVYLFWAIVVCSLYPLCSWYAGIKQRSRHPLLSYL